MQKMRHGGKTEHILVATRETDFPRLARDRTDLAREVDLYLRGAVMSSGRGFGVAGTSASYAEIAEMSAHHSVLRGKRLLAASIVE